MTTTTSLPLKTPTGAANFFQRAPWVVVLLVALVAFGGTLAADYYMDDLGAVTDSMGIGPPKQNVSIFGHTYGSQDPTSIRVSPFTLIPSAIYALTGLVAPANSMVSHLWNLGLHLALSLVVFHLGAAMLQALHIFRCDTTNRRAALLGALVFACHPLGSEAVYYAKCVNTQLVALFVFWATVRAAQFLQSPGPVTGRAMILPAALTLFSYFPGTVQLAASVLVLVLAAGPRRLRTISAQILPAGWWRRPWGMVAAGGVILSALFVGDFFLERAFHNLGDSNVAEHFVTQGRIFWEYARRLVIPTGLCSDHFQPWSEGAGDTRGVMLLGAWGLLTAGLAWLAVRRSGGPGKGLAVLGLLALVPFLIRLLYVNSEIMVEYRAYPAMPWLGLLAGCGLAALWEWKPAPAIGLAAVVIVGGTVLSAERGVVWRSSRTLAENVLTQYPLNNRARTQLQSLDYYERDYASVLRRHQEILRLRDDIVRANRLTVGHTRLDMNRTESATVNSFQWVIYARAESEGAASALVWADSAITSLRGALPERFVESSPGATVIGWPVIAARDAVARAAVDQAKSPVTR